MTAWENSTIGAVCDVVNGGTPKSGVGEFWGGSNQWITPAEMGRRPSPFVDKTERTISDAGLANSSANLLPPNSVILSSRAPIGHLVINTVPMATNQGCKGLVPSRDVETKFLYYYLMSIVPLLNELGTGATFKEISGTALRGVGIRYPAQPEQRRIVGILDKAFEGIATARANAERNLANAQSTLNVAFSLLASSEEQRKWTLTSVRELAAPHKGSIRTGPFGSQLLHSEFVDDGIAVLGIDNAVANEFRWGKRRFITPEKYEQLSRYTVRPGDVLITIMGTCGRCAVVPDDIPLAINTKHLCCITVDREKCLPEFLHGYFLFHPLAREFLAAQAGGSIMDGLNMGIIEELPVLLPSLERQERFVSDLARLRGATASLRAN